MDLEHDETAAQSSGRYAFVVETTGTPSHPGVRISLYSTWGTRHALHLPLAPPCHSGADPGIALQGSLAYVGTSEGLVTVDLGNPVAPRVLGTASPGVPPSGA